jgi:hypothetical protein
MTKLPPGSRWAATFLKQATWAAWVVSVADEVGETEQPVGFDCREVADRDADPLPSRLGQEPRCHRPRELDPAHLDPACGQRQGDPPGPDPELEDSPTAGEPGQEVDRRLDDRWIEQVGIGLVVCRRNPLVEVAVVVGHGSGLGEQRRGTASDAGEEAGLERSRDRALDEPVRSDDRGEQLA